MKTIEDALKYADTFDSPHTQHMSIVMLSAEVRRLRSEIDSARDDLQSFVDDRNHWKTKAEAAQAVLQNLMSYLSVNGCRTEIDPENAELRIRDGINMLVRPALERAERAEKALKEAQEQPAVAWMIHEYQGTGEKRLQFQPHIPSIRDAVTGPIVTALYARPVPAAPAEDLTEMRRVIAGVADRLGLPTENGNRLHDLSFWLDSPPAVALHSDRAIMADIAEACGWVKPEAARQVRYEEKPAVAVPAVPEDFQIAAQNLIDAAGTSTCSPTRCQYPMDCCKMELIGAMDAVSALLQSAEVKS